MPAPEGIGAKRPGELEGFAPRWIKGPAGHEHRVERPQKEKRPHPKAFCFEMPALPVLVPQAGALLYADYQIITKFASQNASYI